MLNAVCYIVYILLKNVVCLFLGRVLRTPACQKTLNARTPLCVVASSPSTFEARIANYVVQVILPYLKGYICNIMLCWRLGVNLSST